jgi:hypothetical protein
LRGPQPIGPPQPTRRKSITHRNLHCPTAQPVHVRDESEVCNAKTAILRSSERPGLASQLSQASRARPHVGRRFRPHRGDNLQQRRRVGDAQPALHTRSARTTASGSASMTRSSVDAGPEGRRRPCSYCCTVSSVKPKRRANCSCVSPSLARRARTWSGDGGGYIGSVGPPSETYNMPALGGGGENLRPGRNGTGSQSAISDPRVSESSECRWARSRS